MRKGPREASRRRRAQASVCSTWLGSPAAFPGRFPGTLPPRASATSIGWRPGGPGSILVVEVLCFLFGIEVGLRELGLDHLVVGDLHGLDRRLLLLEVDGLGGLRLAPAARRLAGGPRLRGDGVLLIGAALRADRLGLAEVVELRTAVVAVVFGSQFQLRHARLQSGRAAFGAVKLASVRGHVNTIRRWPFACTWKKAEDRMVLPA